MGSHSAPIRLLSRTAPTKVAPLPLARAHTGDTGSPVGAGLPGRGHARHAAPPPRGGAIFPGHGRGHRSAPGPRVGLAGGRAGVGAARGRGRERAEGLGA